MHLQNKFPNNSEPLEEAQQTKFNTTDEPLVRTALEVNNCQPCDNFGFNIKDINK